MLNRKQKLVKADLLLASARDGIKRQSAFYDNVIAWSTLNFANKLNLYQILKIMADTLRFMIKPVSSYRLDFTEVYCITDGL
ncbi:MAG TPA: hypothetical protein VMR41_00075 [Patescibacteria group bacterium]|nr:hypothetical protein [Patescibacteria group bacterium]